MHSRLPPADTTSRGFWSPGPSFLRTLGEFGAQPLRFSLPWKINLFLAFEEQDNQKNKSGLFCPGMLPRPGRHSEVPRNRGSPEGQTAAWSLGGSDSSLEPRGAQSRPQEPHASGPRQDVGRVSVENNRDRGQQKVSEPQSMLL